MLSPLAYMHSVSMMLHAAYPACTYEYKAWQILCV